MSFGLKALAWVHIVLGALGLLMSLTVLSWLSRNPDHSGSQFLVAAGPGAAMAILVWFGPMLAGGVMLLRKHPLARVVLWAESALLLGLFPIGTALAGYGIWVLMRPENRMPFQPVPPGFGKAVLVVLAALSILAAMLGVGYLFRDQLNEGSITPPNATVPEFKPPEIPQPGVPAH